MVNNAVRRNLPIPSIRTIIRNRGEQSTIDTGTVSMPYLKQMITAILLVMAMLTQHPAAAGDASNPAFERIITSQIEAFRRDAGEDAFAFASPDIRRQFGSAANFMTMVRNGYPQVYRPDSFRFGKVTREMSGRPTQRVHIIDANGTSWTALYAFEQQPDGSWRIAGVVMLRTGEQSAWMQHFLLPARL
jgi:hypothetical protein